MKQQKKKDFEYDAFLSFSNKDIDFAKSIWEEMRMHGLKVFLSDETLKSNIGRSFFSKIEYALGNSRNFVLICSPNSMKSEWVQTEYETFFNEYFIASEQERRLIILKGNNFDYSLVPTLFKRLQIANSVKEIIDILKSKTEFETKIEVDEKQKEDEVKEILEREFGDGYRKNSNHLKDPKKISISKLPTSSRLLLGRETELKILDKAWEDENTCILTLVAWGGVGKTALVNEWLNCMAKDHYRGAERVYGWSFYSQGTSEDRQTSADEFIDDALGWFGDPDPAKGSPWDKGKRLADLIREKRTLLILDGMEPLQYPPGEMQGCLKDQALQALVKELTRSNPGLCLIATRIKVEDIEHAVDRSVKRIFLEHLTPKIGAELLKQLEVNGTTAELQNASREFKGHALALNLLARYLAVLHEGDIRKMDLIPHLTEEEKEGGHARRIMEFYEKFLSGKPDLKILYILGLFDRPVERGAVEALRAKPVINGLTSELQNLSDYQWKNALKHLRDLNLLSETKSNLSAALDCHPLLREHFGKKLRSNYPKAWKEANSRLYEYFKNLPEKELPDTIGEMKPLFMAVTHGCQAKHYREALDDIYWKRILRKHEFYSFSKLSALGANLAALSGFMLNMWDSSVKELSLRDQAFVMSAAALCLTRLGRLDEASASMESSLSLTSKDSNWQESEKLSRDFGPPMLSGDLGQIYYMQGNFDKAIKYAEKARKFAEVVENREVMVGALTKLAIIKYSSGRQGEALCLFQQAEELQQKNNPEYPLLVSTRGFRYCEFLLDQGMYKEVINRANLALNWAENQGNRLSAGGDHLTLGKAYLLEAITDKTGDFDLAEKQLYQAIEILRKAEDQDSIARGLLAQAVLFRVLNDFDKAWSHLKEVLEIAKLSGMRLHIAEYHLEACRLSIAQAEREKASQHFDEAKTHVNEMGYHLRDSELEELSSKIDEI